MSVSALETRPPGRSGCAVWDPISKKSSRLDDGCRRMRVPTCIFVDDVAEAPCLPALLKMLTIGGSSLCEYQAKLVLEPRDFRRPFTGVSFQQDAAI